MITECEKQLSDHRIISAPENTCSYYVQRKPTMPGFEKHIKIAVLPISHREICAPHRAKKMHDTDTQVQMLPNSTIQSLVYTMNY